jgi:hypothetical protein
MLRVSLESLALCSWEVRLQVVLVLGVLLLLCALSPWLWFNTSLVNNRKGLEILWTNATRRFQLYGKTILEAGFAKVRTQWHPFAAASCKNTLRP